MKEEGLVWPAIKWVRADYFVLMPSLVWVLLATIQDQLVPIHQFKGVSFSILLGKYLVMDFVLYALLRALTVVFVKQVMVTGHVHLPTAFRLAFKSFFPLLLMIFPYTLTVYLGTLFLGSRMTVAHPQIAIIDLIVAFFLMLDLVLLNFLPIAHYFEGSGFWKSHQQVVAKVFLRPKLSLRLLLAVLNFSILAMMGMLLFQSTGRWGTLLSLYWVGLLSGFLTVICIVFYNKNSAAVAS